jgi:uncharacterized iron-regulated membrane protein
MNAKTIRNWSFYLHRYLGLVVGIIAIIIGITGSILVFYQEIDSFILSQRVGQIEATGDRLSLPVQPVSKVISDKATIDLNEILQRAETALPGGKITHIGLPTESEGVFRIGKRMPGETNKWGDSSVDLDRYTGKVLKTVDATKSLSLGETVLNSFTPVHYGTFGGLPTRILYVFVGLSPTILFITGLIMYGLRRRSQPVATATRELIKR